jgi:superfamily II DNA/RNA helicase
MSFKDLGVNAALIKILHSFGIKKPFSIQKAILPNDITGTDILDRGQTGSGKTAASKRPLALVLSPTREFAM